MAVLASLLLATALVSVGTSVNSMVAKYLERPSDDSRAWSGETRSLRYIGPESVVRMCTQPSVLDMAR